MIPAQRCMIMTNNRTTIKILGSATDVKNTAAKIETLFPFYIEGPIKPNDNSDGVHLFITLPAQNKDCSVSPRQETTQTAQTTPLNFSLTEPVFK